MVEIFGDKNGNRMPGDTLFGYGMSIDHVDANKKHNQYTNLELVTHRTNCLRREENIRLHSVGGVEESVNKEDLLCQSLR